MTRMKPSPNVPKTPPTVHVERTPPETPLVDVMNGSARWEARVLDHGLIALLDVMPRLVPEGQTADHAIVQAARVSYGQGTKRLSEDRSLLRYLMRHRHTTPFEMIEFKFHVRLPIFVARQWIRHRTASVNEYSGRYSIMPDRFYRPTPADVREQSAGNRQGGDAPIDAATAERFLRCLDRAESIYEQYEELTGQGVARELARLALPLSTYTEWYWKCDLHNIMHFLSLRLDEHAQHEIRAYAQAMVSLIEPIVPVTIEAFRDYRLEAVHLTRLEIEAIRGDNELATTNRRERAEWDAKRETLRL
ncbi:MAG: FAD-dependent thymidylate synthase [Phycisphaerales bacterium]|nr:FAD-dependent thymidylate synthase [Phycisphaerales bacterium]